METAEITRFFDRHELIISRNSILLYDVSTNRFGGEFKDQKAKERGK